MTQRSSNPPRPSHTIRGATPPSEIGTLTRRGVAHGARLALPFAASTLAAGIAFGLLSRQTGLGLGAAVLMSALVCAGTAQLAVLGLWAAPLPVATIIATTLLVNLRYVLYGVTLPDWLRNLPAHQRYGALYFLSDESWALGMQRFRAGERDAGVLMGAGGCMYAAWALGTAIGHGTGAAISDPRRWGLDFLATALFLALLVALWRENPARTATLCAWTAAAAAAVLTQQLLPGTWYILAGAVAGGLVGGVLDAG